jgi:hypothetical protein
MANRWDLPKLVIGLMDGRWTVAVLTELQDGGRRYQELDHVSHKVLTDTLRRLERYGLVVRHLDPSRVDTATLHQLTDLGRLSTNCSPSSNGPLPGPPPEKIDEQAGGLGPRVGGRSSPTKAVYHDGESSDRRVGSVDRIGLRS